MKPIFLLPCLLMTTATAALAAPAQEPFGGEIAAYEKADAKAAPAKGGVLFVGSSSIRMWNTLARDMRGFSVINRGFGGSVIEQSTLYAPRIVWPYEPRLILLYAGDNDLAGGDKAPQVLADFQAFVARVREKLPATSIAFIAIKPSPSRAALKAEATKANALIRDWIEARRAEKLRFVDVWTPMTDDAGLARRELFGPDMLHMNARGYALWTALVKPHLQAVMGAEPEEVTPEAPAQEAPAK